MDVKEFRFWHETLTSPLLPESQYSIHSKNAKWVGRAAVDLKIDIFWYIHLKKIFFFIPVPDNILGPGSVVAADMDAGPLAVNPEDALVHRVKG